MPYQVIKTLFICIITCRWLLVCPSQHVKFLSISRNWCKHLNIIRYWHNSSVKTSNVSRTMLGLNFESIGVFSKFLRTHFWMISKELPGGLMRTAIISFVHQFSKIKMISKEIGLAYSGKLDFSSKNMGTILFQRKIVAPGRISLIFLKFLTFLDQIYHEKLILIKFMRL